MVHQDLIFQIVAFWNLMEEEQCLAWTRDHVSAVVCRAPRLYLSDPSTLSGNAMGVVGKEVGSEFWLWGFTLQLHHSGHVTSGHWLTFLILGKMGITIVSNNV